MSLNIVVPEVGESIVDARVAKWLKQKGDLVEPGDPIVELETDKINIEVPAPAKGVIESIAQPEGADVAIGAVLGTIAEAAASTSADTAADDKPPASTPATEDMKPAKRRVVESPSVRRAARERTRPATDRPKAEKEQRPAPPPQGAPAREEREGREERVRMSKRRATIASRLVEAQHAAAMLTTFNEVDMSAVMALRSRYKDAFTEKHGTGIGITTFFVKAAIVALAEFPRLNAEVQGDQMVLKHFWDIGIAIGTPEGLVVPVVRDADRLAFAEIDARIADLARRARAGTLDLEDLRGGSFSITNGGVYGSLMSTPILNPPQVGILGLHAIQRRPVDVDGTIVSKPMMYLALTYDHRIVDGEEAVKFLVRIRQLIEDPGRLLIEA